jgi:hypothetical protein
MNSQNRWGKSVLERIVGVFAQGGDEGAPVKIEKCWTLNRQFETCGKSIRVRTHFFVAIESIVLQRAVQRRFGGVILRRKCGLAVKVPDLLIQLQYCHVGWRLHSQCCLDHGNDALLCKLVSCKLNYGERVEVNYLHVEVDSQGDSPGVSSGRTQSHCLVRSALYIRHLILN